jgi:polyphosphate glucokinase
MDRLSKEALNTGGKRRWQRSVEKAVALLQDIFFPDVFQLGGGNAKHVDPVPDKCEVGGNQDGFRGAVRLWPGADMVAESGVTTWRIKRNATKKKEKK